MLIGWIPARSGARGPAGGGMHKGGAAPLVGGAARFWRRGGNPPAPAFPRRGKRERGASKFLAAAGNCLHVMPGWCLPRPSVRKSLQPLKSRNSRFISPDGKARRCSACAGGFGGGGRRTAGRLEENPPPPQQRGDRHSQGTDRFGAG